jgi:hypothetical protein
MNRGQPCPLSFGQMKYGLPLFVFTVFTASLALPQSDPETATKSKTPPKTSSSAARKTVNSNKGKTAKRTTATWRQMAPSADRYREIQQALVEKGYLKTEPNGIWDTQSADALRQFQTDKNLSPTGKLSSASLIALGLGSKTSGIAPPPGADASPGTRPSTSDGSTPPATPPPGPEK